MPVVVDASALLALLRNEAGADVLAALLKETPKTSDGRSGLISAVNWAEVVQVATPRALAGLRREDTPIAVIDFGVAHAEKAASLRSATRSLGLSLADRACLALGAGTELAVVTADGQMAKARVGVEVQHIRPRPEETV